MPPRTFGLRIRRHFPTLMELPSDYEGFYDDVDESALYGPEKHWCLLVEVVEVIPYVRPMFKVKDKANKEFLVACYLDNGSELPAQWKRSKWEGTVLAIMYAERHNFMDGQVGVRLEELENTKILPCNLNTLLMISDEVNKPDFNNVIAKCNMCKRPADLRCSRCVVRYCDKNCQSLDWKASHKHECPALKLVSEWKKRNWDDFEEFW